MSNSSGISKIILDTDPGGDDIFAFFWLQSLVKQGYLELVAVTSAEGNVSAKKTFASTRQILKLGGLPEVEIGRGVLIKGELSEDAAHIHGSDGMGNLSTTLPQSLDDYETARYSDDIIIDKLNAMPDEITLVAIAPLTNLAAAEEKSPGILKKAKQIVVMGGAFLCPGNVTPHAEFNIWFNSAAAKIVFDSRNDLVVMPLNVTRHLIFTREMADTLVQTNPNSKIAKFMQNLCEFMIQTALTYRETEGIEGFLVHDAATIGYLFYPETLTFCRANVYVETTGEWTRGQTLIDHRKQAKLNANAWVALHIDQAGFFTSFVADLKTLIRE